MVVEIGKFESESKRTLMTTARPFLKESKRGCTPPYFKASIASTTCSTQKILIQGPPVLLILI